jgi:hypothetical protein
MCPPPRRIPLEIAKGSEENETDGPSRLLQSSRHDEAVAAIVARSAKHQNRPSDEALHRCRGDRAAGSLHEDPAGHAAGDREGVGPCHLGTVQESQFVSGDEIAHFRAGGLHVRAIGAADRN